MTVDIEFNYLKKVVDTKAAGVFCKRDVWKNLSAEKLRLQLAISNYSISKYFAYWKY